MGAGQELGQIFVSGAILHQDRKIAPVLHRQFGADDWPYSVLAGRDRKSLRAVDAVAIEQRHGRHPEPGGSLSQLLGE